MLESGASNIVIENNILQNNGNSSIQVGGAFGGASIRNNVVLNGALNNDNYHASGVAINPGTLATVENNWIQFGKSVGEGVKAQGVDGCIIRNNVIIGPWTALQVLRDTDVTQGKPFGSISFYNNTAVNLGGGAVTQAFGLYCSYFQDTTRAVDAYNPAVNNGVNLVNNIFAGYNNATGDIYIGNGGLGCLGASYKTQNLFSPNAASVGFNDLTNLDLRLQKGSPAANSGVSLSTLVPTDFNGSTRNGSYDMGAFDSQ